MPTEKDKRLFAVAALGMFVITLLAPVDTQEVWAAGVTYLRSKSARMEESDFSATAYDRVYDAPRPEIFFKSMRERKKETRRLAIIKANGMAAMAAATSWSTSFL